MNVIAVSGAGGAGGVGGGAVGGTVDGERQVIDCHNMYSNASSWPVSAFGTVPQLPGNVPEEVDETCMNGRTARPHWAAGAAPTGASNEIMFICRPAPAPV